MKKPVAEVLIVRLHQAQHDKLQELYGDPRGCFEGWDSRKKWFPAHFMQAAKGSPKRLNMRAWKAVFSMNVAPVRLFENVVTCASEGNIHGSLEALFYIFNQQLDDLHSLCKYDQRSMSVGDVVELRMNGKPSFYYCDSIGFKKISPVNAERLLPSDIL